MNSLPVLGWTGLNLPSSSSLIKNILQIVTMATLIAQVMFKMAGEETLERRPFSCPVGPLTDRKLSAEKLPNTRPISMGAVQETEEDEMSKELLEEILIKRASSGDNLAKFQLGQFYFEREIYDKALIAFERIKSTDFQAKYQLGVMYYDGIGTKSNPVSFWKYRTSIIIAVDSNLPGNLNSHVEFLGTRL